MARPCTVCQHEAREAIDAAIVERQSYRAIARQHGLSKDAVARHSAHVSPALAAMQAQREAAGAKSLLDRIEGLIRRTETFLKAAEASGSVAQGLAAVRELRALLELLGKASGELKEQPAVAFNVLASPDILRYIAVVRDVLSDEPARLAVIAERLQLPEEASA